MWSLISVQNVITKKKSFVKTYIKYFKHIYLTSVIYNIDLAVPLHTPSNKRIENVHFINGMCNDVQTFRINIHDKVESRKLYDYVTNYSVNKPHQFCFSSESMTKTKLISFLDTCVCNVSPLIVIHLIYQQTIVLERVSSIYAKERFIKYYLFTKC